MPLRGSRITPLRESRIMPLRESRITGGAPRLRVMGDRASPLANRT
jgi:hypothetical protein